MAGEVSVKQDNTDQVVDDIDSVIGIALEEIGLLAENYAAKKCPVDTGNLRGSITHEVDAADNAVYMFWSSDILTGSQTERATSRPTPPFWSSDILTGSQTKSQACRLCAQGLDACDFFGWANVTDDTGSAED